MPRPEPETPARYDVIVVLGAAPTAEGEPSPALRRRVAHAVAAWHRGLAPRLLLCGGAVRRAPAEAKLMAGLARAAGVPEDALVLETHSRSTWENAREAAAVLRARGWTSALLVTDRIHLPRARLAFRRAGLAVTGSGVPGGWRQEPAGRGLRAAVREAAALAWYLLRPPPRRPR